MSDRGRRSSADISKKRLVRLATAGITRRRMANAVRDTLAAWRELPDGREHAAQLRAMLAARLASAVTEADAAQEIGRRQVQNLVDVLQAGVEALEQELASW